MRRYARSSPKRATIATRTSRRRWRSRSSRPGSPSWKNATAGEAGLGPQASGLGLTLQLEAERDVHVRPDAAAITRVGLPGRRAVSGGRSRCIAALSRAQQGDADGGLEEEAGRGSQSAAQGKPDIDIPEVGVLRCAGTAGKMLACGREVERE